MFNPWHILAVLAAAAIAFAASVTFALVLGADGRPVASLQTVPASQLPDRTTCDAIFGTAYRSENERRWFDENCSTWSRSIGDVPEPAAPPVPAASTVGPDGRGCDQIRGTAYLSDAERAWYRANCIDQRPPGPRPVTPTPQPSPTPADGDGRSNGNGRSNRR